MIIPDMDGVMEIMEENKAREKTRISEATAVSGWREMTCPEAYGGCKGAKDRETFDTICSRGEMVYRECRGET